MWYLDKEAQIYLRHLSNQIIGNENYNHCCSRSFEKNNPVGGADKEIIAFINM